MTHRLCVLQPQENYNEWRLLYFISFLLLVGFFVLNMFVGVVVENFHKCRESQEKEERAMRAAKRQGKLEKRRKSEKARSPPQKSTQASSKPSTGSASLRAGGYRVWLSLNKAVGN